MTESNEERKASLQKVLKEQSSTYHIGCRVTKEKQRKFGIACKALGATGAELLDKAVDDIIIQGFNALKLLKAA